MKKIYPNNLANFYLPIFQPNPKYSYAYQISEDKEQTYIAHKEDRDGTAVTGEYRYSGTVVAPDIEAYLKSGHPNYGY